MSEASERHPRLRRPRIAATVAAAALFAGVGTVLALTTPWNPLPGPVPGGGARPDPAATTPPPRSPAARRSTPRSTRPRTRGSPPGSSLSSSSG
ncbi:hypothetical protein [Actinomadura sp. CNU-125]|uniref:hypothetical protein n=1 Tax=Actinomadura sp. CNU-125 TaxID=1904961 RepID=UPI001652AD12|nr:hypothetical protein [Actinomadura sp. CNU-125]